jgi:hypothetical protein
MDKLLIRKDVYDELIEKGFGKKDYSKLTKKVITDKNGHKRTVFVKNDVEQTEQKQPNAQEGLTPEKKARYEEMLEKVKAGSDENALFVRGKGMLNKKDAIAHLEGKLGKKTVSSAAEGHLESDTSQNTDITKEDEERFGKQALSGLSGKRTSSEETKNETPHGYILNKLTDEEKNKIYDLFKDADFTKQLDSKLEFHLDDKAGEMILKKMPHGALQSKIYDLAREYNRENFKDARDYKNGLPEKAMGQLYKEYKQKPSQDDMKENYLDAKNEGGKDIADENRIDTHSKNAINLSDSEVKKMQRLFDYIPENANGNQIMNTIYDEDKKLYKKLSDMDIEYKKLHPEAEGKTFGFDLATKYLEDSFNEYKKDHEVGKDKFAEMSVEDIRKEQQNLLDDYNQYYNAYKNGKNDGSKLREYFKKFDVYKTALDKKSKK